MDGDAAWAQFDFFGRMNTGGLVRILELPSEHEQGP
jgi:hypothetical protein